MPHLIARRSGERGFGLAETLVAIAIVSIGLFTFLKTLARDLPHTQAVRLQVTGQMLARQLLEHYARYQGYNTLNATQTPYTLNISAANFPELARLPGGTATVFVDFWYPTGTDVLISTDRDVLRIRVTVNWTPSGGHPRSIILATLVSKYGFDRSG